MSAGDTEVGTGAADPPDESAAGPSRWKRLLRGGLGSTSTTGAVALIALVVSGVSLYLAYRSERTQEVEARVTELRGLYGRIADLETLHSRSIAQNSEVTADLDIAATLLHELGRHATSADAYFIAQGYQNVGFYSSALPLFRKAVSYATTTTAASAALRGAADVEAALGAAGPAEADMRDAFRRAKTQLSGGTQWRELLVDTRNWFDVAVELRRCSLARARLDRYLKMNDSLPALFRDASATVKAQQRYLQQC